MPDTVGIREAKAQLSQLIRRAERGDVVTITHRGRPVARIVPIGDVGDDPAARVEELKRRGWIEDQTPPPVRLPSFGVEPGLAQRYLREDRDSG